jgi:hypothetical protein
MDVKARGLKGLAEVISNDSLWDVLNMVMKLLIR